MSKALPEGFQGLMLKPTGNSASNSTSDAQQRSWQAVGSFQDVILWGHDAPPAATDPAMRCIDWLALADKVGGGGGVFVVRNCDESGRGLLTWQDARLPPLLLSLLLRSSSSISLASGSGASCCIHHVAQDTKPPLLLPLLLVFLLQVHRPVSASQVEEELRRMQEQAIVS